MRSDIVSYVVLNCTVWHSGGVSVLQRQFLPGPMTNLHLTNLKQDMNRIVGIVATAQICKTLVASGDPKDICSVCVGVICFLDRLAFGGHNSSASSI